MKLKKLSIVLLSIMLVACNSKSKHNSQKETPTTFQNKGHELVAKMVEKTGNYNLLLNKKDVIYTYTYQTPNGASDVSIEKYIFKNELSMGYYKHHQRTFPNLVGEVKQGYDGHGYWLKHNHKVLNDSTRLKMVMFNRHTNFYWFAMIQKLLDPGLNYEYIGEKNINKTTYDIVKVSFKSKNSKPTDTYQLYINKKTNLVDQFLFTVADFGLLETPFLMTLEYEKIDGIWIPTQRKYKKSTWNANVDKSPWTNVTWTNIKFNNNLSPNDFKK